MAIKKSGRPFVYQAEDERPVTVSLRVPRDLYAQVQRYVHVRPPMTMTEFLLDAARLKLETPTDPRDIILSDDNTVIHELQAMVDAAVEVALTKRHGQAATARASVPMSAVAVPEISHDDNTVLQPSHGYAAEHGHDLVTEPPAPRKGGRPRSAVGQQILALLAQHREGLTAEQIRGILTPSKPLGDTLAGMRRLGTVRTEGTGRTLRYFRSDETKVRQPP